MSSWEGPSRWINTILLLIVGVIAFDTLFLLLDAQDSNGIVRFVNGFAGIFLAPFEGMFAEQAALLTAAIAILGYCLLAGIALAVTSSVQATRHERAERREAQAWSRRYEQPEDAGYARDDDEHEEWRYADRYDEDREVSDRTRRL